MINSTLFVLTGILCICEVVVRTSAQNHGNKSEEDAIHFYYYPNPLNSSEREELSLASSSSFKNAKLQRDRHAKIIVHGAGGSCLKLDFPFRAVEAYLRAKASGRENYNVFCLDYGPLGQPGPIPGDGLPSIRKRYEYVGELVSEKATKMILGLKANGFVSDFEQIHIIGHSLGGQISGFIGRKIQEKSNYQNMLGRITGLDIMNIFLVYNNEVHLKNQLDLSDAKFVDIIHTSPIGLRGDYGHVDFYPDGGLHQRSCLTKGPVSNVTEMIIGGCSHVIVGKYWENSIDHPNAIKACKAESWERYESKKKSRECRPDDSITFGEYVPKDTRGKYYLDYPLIKI
ncbi:unnamed protein product [Orchesella dallaii]|uniref:Lipase domain-containing protein n=1 Tax=Orchesella dallaii TaxID=48710 RepID=A0ABP1R881_9HEXA